MGKRDPREYWNQQAPGYASDGGHARFGRFLDLYEQDCWRYIEPVLPKVDASVILERDLSVLRVLAHRRTGEASR
jgi:hypothetical protein